MSENSFNSLGQIFPNFIEVGTAFISQNSSDNHLSLIPLKANLSLFEPILLPVGILVKRWREPPRSECFKSENRVGSRVR